MLLKKQTASGNFSQVRILPSQQEMEFSLSVCVRVLLRSVSVKMIYDFLIHLTEEMYCSSWNILAIKERLVG